MRSRMCDKYDVKVRATAERDVREIEILGRSLRWTEEGLEFEASDKHHQTLLEGSKTGNSAAVKPEETGQEEDANMLDAAERKKFRSLGDAELDELG